MNAGAPLLELEGVSKRFGPVQALDRVDFAVHAGEVIGLVGDNGAGKSTMVKTIAGIYGADEGTIKFEGQPVSISKPQDATALGIATVYQTWRSATTSTSSQTSSSAARRFRRVPGRSRASSTRRGWSTRPASCSPTWR